MYESLQRHVDGCGYPGYLVETELAGEYKLREARLLQETGLFRSADVTLCAGMQSYGRNVESQQSHILHYQRVDACAP